MCQGYLKELTEVAPPQHFERANVRVSVVGHGEASVMKGVGQPYSNALIAAHPCTRFSTPRP